MPDITITIPAATLREAVRDALAAELGPALTALWAELPTPPAEDPPVTTPPVVVTPTQPVGTWAVEITGADGKPWPCDLAAAARQDALGLRAEVEVPADVAGCTSLRIVAHGLTADYLDLAVRNDIAMREGGGQARYSIRVLRGGQEALRFDNVVHEQYTGWTREIGTRPPLRWPTLPFAGLPRYAGTVAESKLAQYGDALSAPGWDDLWSNRNILKEMSTTGGRDDIGPTTAPGAMALMTHDQRVVEYVIAQAEAAATIPWHFWDATRGGWLSAEDYPGLWADYRGKNPGKTALLQPQPGNTGWNLDIAHQPDPSFIAYLLTGRRSFLDNLCAQAAWTILAQQPDTRGDTGLIVVNGGQVRGSAWGLRQISEAAWAAPQGGMDKAYFAAAEAANWSWLVSQIPAWTQMQGEAYGWLPGEYGTPGAVGPWQQDYFASTAVAAARRGSPDALAFLKWQSNFLVERFTNLGHDGAAYLLEISDPDTGAIHKTWLDIKAATTARGWSNSDGWSAQSQGGNYAQWARLTPVNLAELLGDAEAADWARRLPAEGAPWTQPADYTRDPLLSVALAP